LKTNVANKQLGDMKIKYECKLCPHANT